LTWAHRQARQFDTARREAREREIEMRSLYAAGLMAGVALAGTAYAQDAATPPPETPAAAETAAYDAGTVLATVNGTEITLGHVIVLRDQLPPQYQNLPDDMLFTGLLDQLVDQELLAEAQSASPEEDPLLVKLQLENDRRGALAGLAAEAAVGDVVDEASVQAAYDAQVAGFQPQTEYNAAHILVADEAKARELKAEIDGGADFAEVAAANSSDGSAANGGDLGWFGAGQMVPEFETAVSALEPGAVSEPVQTQFGWHLIRLNETRESTAPALEEVRAEIENQLRQEALQARIATLKSSATIERPETGLPPAAIRETDLLTN
jgi:peptidyl-prolyl cis-trans isomerase C